MHKQWLLITRLFLFRNAFKWIQVEPDVNSLRRDAPLARFARMAADACVQILRSGLDSNRWSVSPATYVQLLEKVVPTMILLNKLGSSFAALPRRLFLRGVKGHQDAFSQFIGYSSENSPCWAELNRLQRQLTHLLKIEVRHGLNEWFDAWRIDSDPQRAIVTRLLEISCLFFLNYPTMRLREFANTLKDLSSASWFSQISMAVHDLSKLTGSGRDCQYVMNVMHRLGDEVLAVVGNTRVNVPPIFRYNVRIVPVGIFVRESKSFKFTLDRLITPENIVTSSAEPVRAATPEKEPEADEEIDEEEEVKAEAAPEVEPFESRFPFCSLRLSYLLRRARTRIESQNKALTASEQYAKKAKEILKACDVPEVFTTAYICDAVEVRTRLSKRIMKIKALSDKLEKDGDIEKLDLVLDVLDELQTSFDDIDLTKAAEKYAEAGWNDQMLSGCVRKAEEVLNDAAGI